MRSIMVLFMVICLLLMPLTSFSKDLKKYTPKYNSYVAVSLSEEIYKFVGTLTNLENTWAVRRHILLSIFEIIDKYNCSEKLYVVNRGLKFTFINDRVRHIKILIYVMTSLETLDKIALSLDVEKVKEGAPIKKMEKGRTTS